MSQPNPGTPRKKNGRPLPRPEIDELKARVDLAEVVRQSGILLKPVGKNLMGCCPFHEGDREPSLSVNPEAQLWNCFACEAGGDVLRFLQLREKIEFPQALARLQELAGSPQPQPNPTVITPLPGGPRANGNGKKATPSPDRLPNGLTRPQILGRVAQLYAERLKTALEAQQYLASRGLAQRELLKTFQLGYSDGQLMGRLMPDPALREALTSWGLLNAQGQEHFRGCLVVPLSHPEQGVVGFYGRRLDPEASVRHMFLPGPKRGVLNAPGVRGTHPLYLTEGVLDALSLWAAGVREVSCLMGCQGLPVDLAALLEHHGPREIRLGLDADEPGQAATQRLGAELKRLGHTVLRVEWPLKDPNAVLSEQGAEVLRGACQIHRPLEDPPERQRQDTEDGFEMSLGALTYQVTPHGPFTGGQLRATLRVVREDRFYVDSLNLYVEKARTTFANKLIARLGLARPEAERHLLAVLVELEDWVRQPRPEQALSKAAPPPKEVPPAEREEAEAFLRRPDLVTHILEDMRMLGYVGEDKTKLLAYLIGVSRKLDKPLSGIIVSQSGAGKSSLTELVEKLCPEEDVLVLSRVSAQALGYMAKERLKHKLLILEERTGGEAADYLIRTLQTRHKLSQAVTLKDPTTGQMHTQEFEVEGPIAYLETTTSSEINHENATRCFELVLDDSEEQTRRIQENQRLSRVPQNRDRARLAEAICRRHHNAQRLLETVGVFLPWARCLSFPTRWLRTRRDNERFLSLIETVAFLHQHQRERVVTEDGTPYILASLEDYKIAYQLAQEVLDITLHELTRDGRELWEVIRCWVAEQAKAGQDVVFTRRSLRQYTSWQDHRLRQALQELVEMEHVGVVSGQNGKAYVYRLLVADESELPSTQGSLTTPEELERIWGAMRGQ